MISKNLWIFPLIFICSLILFGPSFNYYFFQDDWFVLKTVTSSTLGQLFSFNNDVVYYRPVGMFTFFLLSKMTFGLNPQAFHLVAYLFNFVNIILVWLLIYKMFQNKTSAFISSLLYSTAAFHFMSFSWLSLTWNIIGTSFFLLAIYFFYDPKKQTSYFKSAISLVFFILALLSSEFALLFPVSIVLLEIFLKPNTLRKKIKSIFFVELISSLIILVYLILRVVMFPPSQAKDYALSLSPDIFNNIIWYILWLFNLPEVLKYQLLISELSLSNDVTFLTPFKPYSIPLFTFFAISVISLLILISKCFDKLLLKLLVVASLFMLIGLLPVLLLSNHSYPYYLLTPSLGFFVLIAGITKKATLKFSFEKTFILGTFILSWFLTSFLSLGFTRKTHWITGEQALSKTVVQEVTKKYPMLPTGSKIVIYPSTEQVTQSLMNQIALQVIYNDNSLITEFKDINESEESGVFSLNLK